MILSTDLGKSIERPFVGLATAENQFLGAEPPANSGRQSQILTVDGRSAWVLNVPKPNHLAGYVVPRGKGSNDFEAICSGLASTTRGAAWTVQTMNLPPGRYFPRMARPSHQHPGDFPTPFPNTTPAHAVAEASTQISILADRLRACFQIVTPIEANFGAFGAEPRNILLLAATEFEAQCRAILKANSYQASLPPRRWNTTDYFKLEAALRLEDYSISFPEFPWISPLAPFRGWQSGNTTTSLAWYDAYNAVKHDRENNASRATLERALEAVTAVVIIGLAQFGITFLRRAERWRDLFQISQYPRWSIGDTHGQIHHPETQAGIAVPYPF